MSHHVQNMEANDHTQQLAQEAEQRAKQLGASHMNEAEHAAQQAKQAQFHATATPNPAATQQAQAQAQAKATAKKADK